MKPITVQTSVNRPVEIVWEYYTTPGHIVNWNFASPDWVCPQAVNELHPGGKLNWRMEAKDGSMGFDFKGTYQTVVLHKLLEYELEDQRKVRLTFESIQEGTRITETFDPDENDLDLQRNGWQAILNNFKNYTEQNS